MALTIDSGALAILSYQDCNIRRRKQCRNGNLGHGQRMLPYAGLTRDSSSPSRIGRHVRDAATWPLQQLQKWRDPPRHILAGHSTSGGSESRHWYTNTAVPDHVRGPGIVKPPLWIMAPGPDGPNGNAPTYVAAPPVTAEIEPPP